MLNYKSVHVRIHLAELLTITQLTRNTSSTLRNLDLTNLHKVVRQKVQRNIVGQADLQRKLVPPCGVLQGGMLCEHISIRRDVV